MTAYTMAHQNTYIDDPKTEDMDNRRYTLKYSANDTLKLLASRELGFHFHEVNRNSAVYFHTQQLHLAERLDFKLWQADALDLLGFMTSQPGNYPVSLRYFLKALRIAQNPLNFVNNFSEVNIELIAELKEEIKKGDMEEVDAIATDITTNEEKILHHGKRADGIVKGMLQHSRTATSEKEPTDINMLADEYLRLSYHGLRAKDKSFNADFKTDLDKNLPKINVIPQDIGRVLLNLINNAFYACTERLVLSEAEVSRSTANKNSVQDIVGYKPLVVVSTKKYEDKIEIRVKDNGNGIPPDLKDKIFQPFFTTKQSGEGTGLGLSLSYDIVKKGHGGELNFETKPGESTEFIIKLKI
ncbi:MAG: hypothetical protein GXO89_07230 [Chlorobi bacterium]|nr:hypothetical protein [Chlorobiota bacterium]